MTESAFSVGPLVALDGGDGEALTTWDNRIATLGAAQATLWLGGPPIRVGLPNVPVSGARWASDGSAVLAGTGRVEVEGRTWSTSPAFTSLVQSGPPGRGSVDIRATSWSPDARHVAVLLDWNGPIPTDGEEPEPEVVILDVRGSAAPVRLAAPGASGVRIIGDHVVVAAPTVRALTLKGEEVASLPATPGAPLRISAGDGDGPLFLFDQDWSIRLVDPGKWTVLATWRGSFLDAVAVPGGIIAIDLAGTLHGGRPGRDGVEEVGLAETGIGAGRLAATSDGRLVVMGAGAVPVHTLTYRLAAADESS